VQLSQICSLCGHDRIEIDHFPFDDLSELE
jgi:hypothetical protein